MSSIPDDKALSGRIEYYSPAPEVIEAYAWQVCRALGKEYVSVEIVRDFIAFIQVVVAIHVKYLNNGKGESLDNEHR